MNKPIITRRPGGEYSTVTLSNGFVETLWFPDDGSPAVLVGRTRPEDVRRIHAQHIENYENYERS